jgi:hypothetical protein
VWLHWAGFEFLQFRQRHGHSAEDLSQVWGESQCDAKTDSLANEGLSVSVSAPWPLPVDEVSSAEVLRAFSYPYEGVI